MKLKFHRTPAKFTPEMFKAHVISPVPADFGGYKSALAWANGLIADGYKWQNERLAAKYSLTTAEIELAHSKCDEKGHADFGESIQRVILPARREAMMPVSVAPVAAIAAKSAAPVAAPVKAVKLATAPQSENQRIVKAVENLAAKMAALKPAPVAPVAVKAVEVKLAPVKLVARKAAKAPVTNWPGCRGEVCELGAKILSAWFQAGRKMARKAREA